MSYLFIQHPTICLGYLQILNIMYKLATYVFDVYFPQDNKFLEVELLNQWVYIFLKVLMPITKFEGIIPICTRALMAWVC